MQLLKCKMIRRERGAEEAEAPRINANLANQNNFYRIQTPHFLKKSRSFHSLKGGSLTQHFFRLEYDTRFKTYNFFLHKYSSARGGGALLQSSSYILLRCCCFRCRVSLACQHPQRANVRSCCSFKIAQPTPVAAPRSHIHLLKGMAHAPLSWAILELRAGNV